MNLTINIEPVPLTINADGVALVQGTRVPLSAIVVEYKRGLTPEEILEQYSSLKLADVYAVIGYYLRHQSEVEGYLQKQQQDAKAIRAENERRFPVDGLRDRLLQRCQASGKSVIRSE